MSKRMFSVKSVLFYAATIVVKRIESNFNDRRCFMCSEMDCVRGDVAGCPTTKRSLAKNKHALKKIAQAATDLSENCCSRNGREDSPAGMVLIHEGCPRVIAASKGK
jgi:hypothetical protein